MQKEKKTIKEYKAYEKETGKPPKTIELLKYTGFKNEKEARKYIDNFEKHFEKIQQNLEDMRKEFLEGFAPRLEFLFPDKSHKKEKQIRA